MTTISVRNQQSDAHIVRLPRRNSNAADASKSAIAGQLVRRCVCLPVRNYLLQRWLESTSRESKSIRVARNGMVSSSVHT